MATVRRVVVAWMIVVLLALPGGAEARHSGARGALTAAPAERKQGALGGVGGSAPRFVENVGQWEVGARFQMWGGSGWGLSGATTWLAEDAIWITLGAPVTPTLRADNRAWGEPAGREPQGGMEAEQSPTPRAAVHLKVSFVDANPHPKLEAYGRVETRASYLIGAEPKAWHAEVPVWGGVRYVDLYPGVDLVIGADEDGSGVTWPWRLEVRDEGRAYGAGAYGNTPLRNVRMRVEGADGLSLEGGALRAQTALGALRLPLLAAEGAPTEAAALVGTEVRAPFAPGGGAAIDVTVGRPADLLYATFLGGGAEDGVGNIAVDGAGCAYLTGHTYSADFPAAVGPGYDPSFNGGGNDAYVLKLNASGTDLLYATFLGGAGEDWGYDIAVDGADDASVACAYLTGWTGSADFPAAAGPGYDTSYHGSHDAFALKLNATGTALLYGTFLGGDGEDWGSGIAVDGAGCAYVTGGTSSSGFPAALGPGYDTSHNGWGDAFVLKLNAAGTGLLYATFLGGTSGEGGSAIAVDGAGCAYVAGFTLSADFPAVDGPGYDKGYHDYGDAFALKLDAAGTGLLYATFLGGNDSDNGSAIAVDGAGCAYVTGTAASSDFPAALGPGYDTGLNGGWDAYVVKLNAAGTGLVYATFLGTASYDGGNGIAVDWTGCAYVTGATYWGSFPAAAGPGYDTSFNGGGDAFVLKLNATGTALLYGTFLGGAGDDRGYGIAVDGAGGVFVAGNTQSLDFPAAAGPGYDTSHNGGEDGFALELATGPTQPLSVSKTDGQSTFYAGWDLRYAIVITNTVSVPLHGVVCTDTLPPELYVIAPLPAGATTNPDGSLTWQVGTLAGDEVRQAELWVRSYVTARGMLTNTVRVGCAGCVLRVEASDGTVFVAAPVASATPLPTATSSPTGTPTPPPDETPTLPPTETPTLPPPIWTPSPTGTGRPTLPLPTPSITATPPPTATPTLPRWGVWLPLVWVER